MNAILALLCPPAAVLRTGRPHTAVFTLALTLLFWLPGMIHAMLIVSQDYKDERDGRLERPQESPRMASLSLVALLAAVTVGALCWPAFNARFITRTGAEPEPIMHIYR